MLIFFDGFDQRSTINTGGLWTGASFPCGPNGRTGRKVLVNSSTPALRTVAPSQEHGTFIVGMAIKPVSGLGDLLFLEFWSSTSASPDIRVKYGHEGTNGNIRIQRGDTVIALSPNNVLAAGAWQFVEAKVVLSTDTQTNGSVVVRVNGTVVIDRQNIQTRLTTSGSGNLNRIRLYRQDSNCDVDDLYLCNGAGSENNDFLGDCIVVSRMPNNNGATNQFTSSSGNPNWENVDEVPEDISNYNFSSTNDHIDLYQVGGMELPANASILGVQLTPLIDKDTANPRGFAHVVRVGNTNYFGSRTELTQTPTYHPYLLEKNPANNQPWTKAVVDAVQVGVQCKD